MKAVDEVVEPNWGVADTVECHKVGPGIEYTKIIYPSQPLILWYTVIDLTNPYNKIEQAQSRHQVPDIYRWDVMTHYKENSRSGHNVKVAWNHDFFSYDMGICIGSNIENGEMTWTTTGRSLLAITKDKKVEIFCPNNYEGKVIAPDGTSTTIDKYNSAATGLQGDCILFNRMNATTLTEGGTYIKIKPQGEWLVNGPNIPCEVLAISTTPLQTSATEYVVYLRNSKTNIFNGHLNVGDKLEISQRYNTGKWGVPPDNILNAFHGYPSIARDGKFHDGEYNDFEGGREYEKSSHVMVGINKEKTKVYVLINEMSSQSIAVDCVQLTSWMINRGAWDVVNYDSGGSSAIVIDEEMLNLPGRGSVRPVEDAMLAVSLAPDDSNVDHLTFSKPYINPSVISLTPLRVLSYNQYDEILSKDLKGCTFSCEPSSMGYVDDDEIFHSSATGMAGKIIAEKDGKRAEINVITRSAGSIYPRLSNILIDGKRNYLIEIVGETPTEKFPLDPSAFNWVSSEPQVCIVEDGVLKGLTEGTSTLTATFDNLSFNINVTVEIPKEKLVVDQFNNLESLNLATSGVKNMTVSSTNLPNNWTDGGLFTFEITSSRSPYFKFDAEKKIYSLPDSLSFQVFNKNDIIKSMSITYSDNLGEKYTKSYNGLKENDSTYVATFMETDNTNYEIGKFPITIKSIQFNLQNSKVGTGNEIALRNLMAYYPKGSGVEDNLVTNSSNKLNISVLPEMLELAFNSKVEGKAMVNIYSTTGYQLYHSTADIVEGNNKITLNSKEATCGVYIVTISTPTETFTGKCIIR